MLESKQVEINGRTYSIGTLPITPSQDVFLRLTRCLGPVAAEFVESLGNGGTRAVKFGGDAVPVDSIGALIREVSLRLDGKDLTAIRLAFGGVCTMDGKVLEGPVQELHFAGRIGEMFQWLRECIAFNYADFLALGLSAVRSANATPAPSKPAQ